MCKKVQKNHNNNKITLQEKRKENDDDERCYAYFSTTTKTKVTIFGNEIKVLALNITDIEVHSGSI